MKTRFEGIPAPEDLVARLLEDLPSAGGGGGRPPADPPGGDSEDGSGDEGGGGSLTLQRIFEAMPRPVRRRVVALLKKHYPDYAGPITALLRTELQPISRELRAIGLVADYAAYMIPYHVYTQAPSADAIDELGG